MKNELREEQARSAAWAQRCGADAAARERGQAAALHGQKKSMEEAHAAALDKLKDEAATALAATEAGHATLAEAAEAELDSLRAAFAAERALADARSQKQSSDRRKEAAAHARGVRSALSEELAVAQKAHAADVGRLQEALDAATTAHAAD